MIIEFFIFQTCCCLSDNNKLLRVKWKNYTYNQRLFCVSLELEIFFNQLAVAITLKSVQLECVAKSKR